MWYVEIGFLACKISASIFWYWRTQLLFIKCDLLYKNWKIFPKGVWGNFGRWDSCFHLALPRLPQDPLCLIFWLCLRNIRSAHPGRPRESWGQPQHRVISPFPLSSAVGAAVGPSGGRQPCGAVLPPLSPISLRSRMTSFKAKVHCSNWIFSILRGVKINILLSLFTHKLESSKCDIWKELHDYNLKWEQRFILCSFLFFFLHCRLWKRKRKNLNTIKAEESQGPVPQR